MMKQTKKPTDTSALWAATAVLAVIRAKTTSSVASLAEDLEDRDIRLQDEPYIGNLFMTRSAIQSNAD